MDIDFIIQDTYALTRPQWKLAANFEEAGRAFAESVAQNYKSQEADKLAEAEGPDDEGSSEDDADDDDLQVPEMDDGRSSSEEAETEVRRDHSVVTHLCADHIPSPLQTAIQGLIPNSKRKFL